MIGIALGGGAARGAAHVGVLEVLLREGIAPSIVAGTSAGAVVGALYAASIDMSEVASLLGDLRWPRLLRPAWKKLSVFDTTPLERVVHGLLEGRRFVDLDRTFAAVAADICTGERVALLEGDVAQAVRASCAVPGLFPPVEVGGRLLVDGGVVDNVPSDVVRELGGDFVVAVDVLADHTRPRPRNLVEVAMAGIEIQIQSSVDAGRPDFRIPVSLGAYDIWDLSRAREFRALGVAAAERCLPALVERLEGAAPLATGSSSRSRGAP